MSSVALYTIKTSCGSGYDIDAAVYDSDNNLIDSDGSSSNANLSVYMLANKTYYIGIWDYNSHVADYLLYVY